MLEHFNPFLVELEEMAQVQRVTRQIDGWLTELEGAALYHAARFGPRIGSIVEIGSFKGKSTIWLACGSKASHREPVYAIDPHTGSPEHRSGGALAAHMPAEGTTELVFRQNIRNAGVENWVIPMIQRSEDALGLWRYPIRLLFIDANHAYEAVRHDFLGWERYVVNGGLVAFHDVDKQDGTSKILDGPTKVVYEDVAQIGSYSAPTIINHLAFVSKVR